VAKETLNERIDVLLEFNRFYATRIHVLEKPLLANGLNSAALRVFLEVGRSPCGTNASWMRRSLAIETSYLTWFGPCARCS